MHKPVSEFMLLKNTNTACSTCHRYQTPSSPVITNFDQPEIRHGTEDQDAINTCLECQGTLRKLTLQRKHNISIEYENAKLKQEIDRLKADKQELIKRLEQKELKRVQEKPELMESSLKADLQSELFECKFVNQLILLGQYKNSQSQSQFQAKYEKKLIQCSIMQEQLMMKDRIIKGQDFYPLHHYDSRIRTLRTALMHFYHIAMKDCKKIKESMRDIRKQCKDMQKQFGNATQEIKQMTEMKEMTKMRLEQVDQQPSIEQSQRWLQKTHDKATINILGTCSRILPAATGRNTVAKTVNSGEQKKSTTLKTNKKDTNKSEQKPRKKKTQQKHEKSKEKPAGIRQCNCTKPNCTSNVLQVR